MGGKEKIDEERRRKRKKSHTTRTACVDFSLTVLSSFICTETMLAEFPEHPVHTTTTQVGNLSDESDGHKFMVLHAHFNLERE